MSADNFASKGDFWCRSLSRRTIIMEVDLMCAGVFDDVDLAAKAFDDGDIDGAERLLDQIDVQYGDMRSRSNSFPGLQPVWKRCRELRTEIKKARTKGLCTSEQFELHGAATC
jgi:hypothetical protein